MSELTAIDVLIDPDDTMLGHARATNAKLRASFPDGFALDAHHQPHITILQRYVRTADLHTVFDAVGNVMAQVDMASLALTAVKYAHMEVAAFPGAGLAGIVVQPGNAVLEFQARLIDAIQPFAEQGGTAEAFVRTTAEPEINGTTVQYIEEYVPVHSGDNYLAHVTVGLAQLEDLAKLEAQPFETFTFSPAGLSVYQLGNNGTAAKKLTSWTVAD